MVAVLLGLGVSASFSVADFLGGVASRRSDPWQTVLANQAIGLAPLVLYFLLLGGGTLTGADVGLSVLAGLASVAGLGLLFGGFAVGRMVVVAPITAGIGGVVPILWGLAQGERPGAVNLLGAVVALAAAVVLARSEAPVADAGAAAGPGDDVRASLMAVGAGLAFGVILIALSETNEDAGLWPPVIAHLVAIPVLTGIIALRRRPLVPPPEVRPLLLGSGLFDATGIALLQVALRQDLVSLVAPAASLYPAGTVVLAATVLGERLHRTQVLALVAAALGLVLLVS